MILFKNRAPLPLILVALLVSTALCQQHNLFDKNTDDEDQYDTNANENENESSGGFGSDDGDNSSTEIYDKNMPASKQQQPASHDEVKRPVYGKPNEMPELEKKSQERPAQQQPQQPQQNAMVMKNRLHLNEVICIWHWYYI